MLTNCEHNLFCYEYEAGIKTNSTTNKVSIMDNNGEKIGYTYDKNGNIETITYNKGEGTENEKTIYYTYNELNELICEENQVLNKTITYSYDVGGNILKREEFNHATEVTEPHDYKYEDTNWKDKLTSFDGKAITYDAIGNPLSDGSYTYTWENGRQLKSITNEGLNISFKYNDSGIRTEKTVNGKTTKYHLVGNKVTFETDGENSIYYTYDSNDNLVSMNLNGVEYYYIRNAQGDITGLFDKTGKVVVSYTYDSWGKLISIDGELKDTVGKINPYRYRGYRYDDETQLYYLQSRYYNPSWGRFINADAIGGVVGELLSHNVFAYCANNAVNLEDPSGFMHRSLSEDGGGSIAEMQAVNSKIINSSKPVVKKSPNAVQKNLNRVVDNTAKLIKGNKVGIATAFIGGSAGAVSGGAKKLSLHFSKSLAKRERMELILSGVREGAKNHISVKIATGISAEILLDPEGYLDQKPLGQAINKKIDEFANYLHGAIGGYN